MNKTSKKLLGALLIVTGAVILIFLKANLLGSWIGEAPNQNTFSIVSIILIIIGAFVIAGSRLETSLGGAAMTGTIGDARKIRDDICRLAESESPNPEYRQTEILKQLALLGKSGFFNNIYPRLGEAIVLYGPEENLIRLSRKGMKALKEAREAYERDPKSYYAIESARQKEAAKTKEGYRR